MIVPPCVCVCVCRYPHMCVVCVRCPASDCLCVEELCVRRLVGLCGGINSLVRQAWLSPREAQSSMFILHLRRLLADEDVHMQD